MNNDHRAEWPLPTFQAPTPTIVLYRVTLPRKRGRHTFYVVSWPEAASMIREYEEQFGRASLKDVAVAVCPLQYSPLRMICEILDQFGIDDVNDQLGGVIGTIPIKFEGVDIARDSFRSLDHCPDTVGLALDVVDLAEEVRKIARVEPGAGESALDMAQRVSREEGESWRAVSETIGEARK